MDTKNQGAVADVVELEDAAAVRGGDWLDALGGLAEGLAFALILL